MTTPRVPPFTTRRPSPIDPIDRPAPLANSTRAPSAIVSVGRLVPPTYTSQVTSCTNPMFQVSFAVMLPQCVTTQPGSVVPLQSLSNPSQVSVPVGLTVGCSSSQSSSLDT